MFLLHRKLITCDWHRRVIFSLCSSLLNEPNVVFCSHQELVMYCQGVKMRKSCWVLSEKQAFAFGVDQICQASFSLLCCGFLRLLHLVGSGKVLTQDSFALLWHLTACTILPTEKETLLSSQILSSQKSIQQDQCLFSAGKMADKISQWKGIAHVAKRMYMARSM